MAFTANTANYYGSANMVFDHARDQAERRRDRAPGLDGRTIDNLLRDAWLAGFQEGRVEGREEGYREGERHGASTASADYSGRIENVVKGRLNHVVNGLTVIAQRRKKTTIADERKWMEKQANDVQAAIRGLVQ